MAAARFALRVLHQRFRLIRLVALVVGLAGCGQASIAPGSPSPVASVEPSAASASVRSSEAPASPSPTPASTPVADWSAVVFDRPEQPSGVRAIAQHGDRLVAVGTAGRTGAAWTLDPGGEWTRATDVPAAPPAREIVGLSDVVAGPAGLVAVGIVGLQQSEAFGTVIWTSPDGVTWREAQRIDGSLLGSVAAGERGYIAVGAAAGVASPTQIEVRVSGDGASWREADTDALGTGGMSAAIPHNDGFLAVGNLQGTDSTGHRAPAHAAAWSSPDGLAWSELWTEEAESTFLSHVTATERGLLAVGEVFEEGRDPATFGTPLPHAWRSADGEGWEATPFDADPGQVAAVSSAASGLVAVGFLGRQNEEHRLAVWTSHDGAAWRLVEEVADQPPGSLSDVAVLADRVVAVGGLSGDDPSGDGAQALVVTGPLP